MSDKNVTSWSLNCASAATLDGGVEAGAELGVAAQPTRASDVTATAASRENRWFMGYSSLVCMGTGAGTSSGKEFLNVGRAHRKKRTESPFVGVPCSFNELLRLDVAARMTNLKVGP